MSAPMAPLCVPVELCLQPSRGKAPGQRWFRLALGISEEALRLRSAVPDELREAPLQVRLHLPSDAPAGAPGEGEGDSEAGGALLLSGRSEEVIVDQGEDSERAEHRQLRLRSDSPVVQRRLARYVQRRLAE